MTEELGQASDMLLAPQMDIQILMRLSVMKQFTPQQLLAHRIPWDRNIGKHGIFISWKPMHEQFSDASGFFTADGHDDVWMSGSRTSS